MTVMTKITTTLAAIVLSAGCMDYKLNNVSDETDTGFLPENSTDTNNSGYNETYNPCDPSDVNWDQSPEGTERSACIGIEDTLLIPEISGDLVTYTTQLYVKDCGYTSIVGGNPETNLQVILRAKDVDGNEVSGFSYGLSNYNLTCGQPEDGFVRLNITPYESTLSSEVVLYTLWPMSKAEYDALGGNMSMYQMTENDLKTALAIEPLKGIIDCRDAESLTDCQNTLYH